MSPAEALTKSLRGQWHKDYGSARCPAHDDHSPSLSIADGKDGVVVKCHTGCAQGDVLAALRRLRLWPDGREHDRARPSPASSAADQNREFARRIWGEAMQLSRSPGAAYLIARGITLTAPPSLRWHRGLKHAPTGLTLPAMIAALQAPDRSTIAVQRTFLTLDGKQKAPFTQNKMTLGSMARGAVRLAAAGPELGIAEGTETGLAAMEIFGVPVWATLGAERLGKVELPADVARVVIFADNGEPGHAAAMKAVEAFTRQGRKVTLRFPPDEFSDFNDLLRAKAAK
jgi:hypothetical protein